MFKVHCPYSAVIVDAILFIATWMLISLLCYIYICRIESVSVGVKCAVRGNCYRAYVCI